jgi:hypothetical protein
MCLFIFYGQSHEMCVIWIGVLWLWFHQNMLLEFCTSMYKVKNWILVWLLKVCPVSMKCCFLYPFLSFCMIHFFYSDQHHNTLPLASSWHLYFCCSSSSVVMEPQDLLASSLNTCTHTHNTLKSHISDSVYKISTYYSEQTLRVQYACPQP